jgi:hypothetical protein
MNMVLHPNTIRSPLKSLWNWLTDSPQAVTACRPTVQLQRCSSAAPSRSITQHVGSQDATAIRVLAPASRSSHRPLRTLRVMEVGQTPGQVGRMVMSGRMADVCAELDRLVACEARLH